MTERVTIAQVQYNDWQGTTAADFDLDLTFDSFLKHAGISNDFYPVGISVRQADGEASPSVTVYAIQKVTIGENAEELATLSETHDGSNPLRVYRFCTELTPGDLLKFTKRCELLFKHRVLKDVPFIVTEA